MTGNQEKKQAIKMHWEALKILELYKTDIKIIMISIYLKISGDELFHQSTGIYMERINWNL